ncbi:MAG: cupin domain-containing protein [Hyphomicrobiales bacterium]|nr:cupin domain-containing protein [Hyphomicrobiales bacterium]
MPKIDVAKISEVSGSFYPAHLGDPCLGRHWKRLGDAAGLTQFGANLVRVEPGAWSSLRHWHEEEDEFLIMVSGELVLVEDEGETVMRSGDCAGFPVKSGNGHHLVNRSRQDGIFLVVGTRGARERCHYPDADLLFVEDEKGARYTTRSGELLLSL